MNENNHLARKLAEDYWLRKLAGIEDRSPLFPYKSGAPTGVDETGLLSLAIPPAVVDTMNRVFTGEKALANKFLVYLAVLKLLYRAYTGCDDIIIGTPGMKLPGVPHDPSRLVFLRDSWENKDDAVFRDLLRQQQQVLLEALENRDYDFPAFLEKYRLNHPGEDLRLFCLGLFYNRFNYPSEQSDRFEVTVSIIEPGENENGTETKLEVRFPGQVNPVRVRFFMQNYLHTLAYVLENRETKLADIDVISPAERELIEKYSAPDVGFPLEKTVLDLFREQVDKIPDAVAIVYGNRQLTYRELSTRSVRLAGFLRNRFDLHGEDIVGIMMDRSDDMVIAVIGVLIAGCAYVFIDPAYPSERVRFIIEDTACKTVVTESGFKENSEGHWPVETPNPVITLDNTAFIIYTSGSTGVPKGILQTHRCLANVVLRQAHHGGFEKNLRVLQFSSAGFDVFIAHELFFSLLSGGRLEIIGEAEKRDLVFLGNFIVERKIQWLLLPVTVLNMIFDLCEGLWSEDVSMRHMIGTGEKLHLTPLLIRYLERHPRLTLHNFYGPAETHNASNYTLPAGGITVVPPIGRPCTNTWIYILSAGFRFVPIGVSGEIYITGAGVAKGYLNSPEATCEKFLTIKNFCGAFFKKRLAEGNIYKTGDLARWQSDGNIEFLGRVDDQVKIRGIRIEPGEIETQLTAHENIKEAIVMVRENAAGEKYLCAYVVFHILPASGSIDLLELRDYLAKKLPDYMVPAYFVPMRELPLNASGKIDRKALPEPGTVEMSPGYIAPRDKIEAAMVQLWAEVLETDPGLIGIDTSFFALGGHSLKAAVLLFKIHKEFNVKITLGEFFKQPTVRQFVKFLGATKTETYSAIEPAEKKDYYKASAAQKRLYILQQVEKDSIGYNEPIVVAIQGKLDLKKLENTFRRMIQRHESLRTSFEMIGDEIVQRIHDNVEFAIEYFDKELATKADKAIIQSFIRPFDLLNAPLLRVGLLRTGVDRYILILDIHHIITDGVSILVIINEIEALFADEELDTLSLQYKDFSEWQNAFFVPGEMKKQETYWLKEFKDGVAELALPLDYPRPEFLNFDGNRIDFELEKEEITLLKKIAAAEGTTLFMVLLAVFTIFLSKVCDREDIIVGTPIAGRRHNDLDRIVGFFINMLALRNVAAAGKTFRDFVVEVKNKTLNAYDNQDYPFENLVDKVFTQRQAGRNSLIDVVFVFHNMDVYVGKGPAVNIPDLCILPYEEYKKTVSPFDLILQGREIEEKLSMSFHYRTALFKEESIRMFIQYFKEIATTVSMDVNIKLGDIRLTHDLLTIKPGVIPGVQDDFVF